MNRIVLFFLMVFAGCAAQGPKPEIKPTVPELKKEDSGIVKIRI